MTGVIKTYTEEQQYGFIRGDDKKDYFFHISSIPKEDRDKICEDALVTFEQKATPKGYTAIKISIDILDDKDIKYIVPNEVYISQNDNIKGWETICMNTKTVHASSRTPNEAKQKLKRIAELSSANALLNMYRYTTTGSEMSTNAFGMPNLLGTHKYTVHNFTANVANIGKKSAKGTHTKKELINLENVSFVSSSTKSNGRTLYMILGLFIFAMLINIVIGNKF
jgi:cold shock CspA family protein